MSNYNTIAASIRSQVKENGNNEITGQIMQTQLLAMVGALGYGYQMMGVASPVMNPGTPDSKICYIAYIPGTYSNFGNISVTGLCLLKYDTSWHKEEITVSGGTIFEPNTDDLELTEDRVLQFANRVNPTNTNGRGYTILRRDKTFAEQVTAANTIYEVRYDFNLAGSDVALPANSILLFNGGRVYGAKISGGKMPSTLTYTPEMFGAGVTSDDTQAIQNAVTLCYCVRLVGTYNVSSISGHDSLSPDWYRNPCIIVPSDTHIQLEGTINLVSSNLSRYAIFSVASVNNVKICGGGKIIGDRESTTQTSGEWGMGVAIHGNASQITIDGIKISQCFGDGVMISAYSTNYPSEVLIHNVEIHHCRRQGVSVTCGDKIVIDGFYIHNINDTMPKSAIDVENETGVDYGIGDVLIQNGIIADCEQGIVCNLTTRLARSIIVDNIRTNSPIWAGTNSIVRNCIGMLTFVGVSGSPIIENCFFGCLQATSTKAGTAMVYGSYFQGLQNESGSTNMVDLFDCTIEINNYDDGTNYERVRIVYCPSSTRLINMYRCSINYIPDSEAPHFLACYNATFHECKLNLALLSNRFNSCAFMQCDITIKQNVVTGYIYNSGLLLRNCKITIPNVATDPANRKLYRMYTNEDNKLSVLSCEIFADIPNPQGVVFGTISDLSYIKDYGTIYRVANGELTYPNKGVTSVRTGMPTNTKMTGKIFFDETLGKSVVFNGTAWVNVDGTTL